MIQDFQGFSKTNSLIKKLYTKDGKKKGPGQQKKKINDGKLENLLNATQDHDKEDGMDKQRILREEIEDRGIFSYKFSRHWCL